jgi:hypothetical protein
MSETSGGRMLTTEEATVQTLSVDLAVVRVGKRQMTLSVFKQLKEEPIINVDDSGDAEFRGTPWGLVNYHSDGCVECSPHLHVVWQKAGELRRSYVVAYPGDCREVAGIKSNQQETSEFLNILTVLARCAFHEPLAPVKGAKYPLPVSKEAMFDCWGNEERQAVSDFLDDCECGHFFKEPPQDEWGQDYVKIAEENHQKVKSLYRQTAKEWDLFAKVQENLEAVLALSEKELADDRERLKKLYQNYRNRYAELEALGQLFVAV